jgi:hypothetical protein
MKEKPKAAKKRHVATTLLLVGEGDAELVWLGHLKRLYVARGAGLVVTLKNAHGKGAAHVVDVAIRQSRNAAFDVKAVLLDTDTDWTQQLKVLAKEAGVEIVAATPCLEGVLLRAHGCRVTGRTSARLKTDFAKRFGADALDINVYQQHFPREFVEESRKRVAEIDQLLRLLMT